MTLVLAAMLGACSEPPHAAVGPTVTVAEGRAEGVAWRFEVYRTSDGWCESIAFESRGTSEGCSDGPDPVAGAISFGQAARSDAPTIVHGRTSDDVAVVRVQTRHDGVVEVETEEAPAELGLAGDFFVAVLPEASVVLSLETLDADGTVLDSVDTGLSP
jgi:hypothetical protein